MSKINIWRTQFAHMLMQHCPLRRVQEEMVQQRGLFFYHVHCRHIHSCSYMVLHTSIVMWWEYVWLGSNSHDKVFVTDRLLNEHTCWTIPIRLFYLLLLPTVESCSLTLATEATCMSVQRLMKSTWKVPAWPLFSLGCIIATCTWSNLAILVVILLMCVLVYINITYT